MLADEVKADLLLQNDWMSTLSHEAREYKTLDHILTVL